MQSLSKEPPVQSSIMALDSSIAQLRDALEALYSRLQHYMATTDTPCNVLPPIASVVGTSPCTAKLISLTETIYRITNDLKIVTDKLEV